MAHYLAIYSINYADDSSEVNLKLSDFVEYCFDRRDRFTAEETSGDYLKCLEEMFRGAKINLESFFRKNEFEDKRKDCL